MGGEVSFGDVAVLVRDVVQPEDAPDLPYIGLEHIEQASLRLAGWGNASDVASTKFLFRKGDILFGKLRPYFRKVVRAPFDGICSTDIWVVRAKPGFDQGYLFYWMAAQDFVDFASGGSEGTRMPRAKWAHVERFTRPRLELPEQRAIARILGALDDKIELNRRMNETLEAMAQALFKSWFVDFDSVVVNALRAGNPIPEKFAARAAHYRDNPDALGLPDDLLRLFPARFVDSELGPIPEGWEVKPIGEMVKCVGGATPSTKNPDYWEGGTNPFLTPRDMASLDAPVVLDTERHITDAGVARISSGQLPVGTVLLSSRAPIGYLAINAVPVSVNQGIIAMICDGPVPNYYVYFCVKENMSAIKGKAGGTTFAEISKRNFRPIPMLIPSYRPLAAFGRIADSTFMLIVENVKSSRTLAALRDTLLPKLISGELRVPDVEKILEAAV